MAKFKIGDIVEVSVRNKYINDIQDKKWQVVGIFDGMCACVPYELDRASVAARQESFKISDLQLVKNHPKFQVGQLVKLTPEKQNGSSVFADATVFRVTQVIHDPEMNAYHIRPNGEGYSYFYFQETSLLPVEEEMLKGHSSVAGRETTTKTVAGIFSVDELETIQFGLQLIGRTPENGRNISNLRLIFSAALRQAKRAKSDIETMDKLAQLPRPALRMLIGQWLNPGTLHLPLIPLLKTCKGSNCPV